MPAPRVAAGALGLVLALLGLGMNTAHEVASVTDWTQTYPRYWQDNHLAIGVWRAGRLPVFLSEPGADPTSFFLSDRPVRRRLGQGWGPWAFWRVVPERAFAGWTEVHTVRRYDDAGRALLLGLAFRLRGGMAPLLLFWLGTLLAVPVVAWFVLGLASRGRPAAAVALGLLVGCWPFAAEAFALSYSPAGFYVLATLLLASAALACLRPPLTGARGVVLRAALAGILFAVLVLCRSGCLALVPGFLAAFAVAARRLASPLRARVAAAATALALFLAPTLVLRSAVAREAGSTFSALGEAAPEPQEHAVWWGVWTGLGDYDRSKGYRWRDRSAAAAVAAAGGPEITAQYYDPRAEAILRDLVLRDIRQDPAWYAGILLRRLVATVSLRKLWPWGPSSGRSIAPATTFNEGVMDAYYALVTAVDWIGVGGRRGELPAVLIPLPTVGLVAWWLARRRQVPGLGDDVGVLAIVGASTLVLPVGISTASGIEPQAFAVTYLVGTALFVDRALTAARRSASRRSTIRP